MSCKITEEFKKFWALPLKERNEIMKAKILKGNYKDDWGVLKWDIWHTFSEEEKKKRLLLVLTWNITH